MTWKGRPVPPKGYELAAVRAGDTLATLVSESGRPIGELLTANGIPNQGRVTCTVAKDISAWLLATGGVRYPVVHGQENACEPGLGYTGFTAGQNVNLPAGLRPRAPGAPAPKEEPVSAASAAGIGGAALLGLGGLALLVMKRKRKKAA